MTTPAGIDAAAAAVSTSGLPLALIDTGVSRYPKPAGVTFAYGTAGVRTRGDILASTCYRLALISALRSKSLGGKMVGMMVTASHNPEEVSAACGGLGHVGPSLLSLPEALTC